MLRFPFCDDTFDLSHRIVVAFSDFVYDIFVTDLQQRLRIDFDKFKNIVKRIRAIILM